MQKIWVTSILLTLVLFLNFGLVASSSGSTDTYVTTTGFTCYRTNLVSYWNNDGSGSDQIIYNASGMVGNATEYSAAGSYEYCCPIGYSFDDNKCIYDPNNIINACADLESKEECEGAPHSLSYSILESFNDSDEGVCGSVSGSFTGTGGKNCANATSCSCVWDYEDNVCAPNRELSTYCQGDGETNSSCTWIEIKGTADEQVQCNTVGKIIINYEAKGSALGVESWCVNQTKEYPCSVSVKLPFFDKTIFLISILGIVLVYVFLGRNTMGVKKNEK